jgi:acetyl esterase/lipase
MSNRLCRKLVMRLRSQPTRSARPENDSRGVGCRAFRRLCPNYGTLLTGIGALIVSLVMSIGWSASAVDDVSVPTQPTQPSHGPGSSDYAHAKLEVSKHGRGKDQYWLITPSEPAPEYAPVIVFLHGWAATDPDVYGAWIKHLVRRGNIVIYPRYQEGLGSLPSSFVDNAVRAIHDGLARLQAAGGVQPDMSKLAFVGHSMGAIMSANIAQQAGRHRLPPPRCLFLAEPTFEPIVGSYDQIHAETHMIVAVGADVKRDASAQRILQGAIKVPALNKNYVAFASDPHGNPPLVSDHFAPCAAEQIDEGKSKSARSDWRGRTQDALDFFGYWKLCDGLLDAAFHGVRREFAFGDTPQVRFMGRWSDGTPVQEAIVRPINDPIYSASN